MYAHIFTTSHCLQTTSIHLLTRGVIVDGVGGGLEMILERDNLHTSLAFVPLCCTSVATSCQRPQCHFLFATLQISMTEELQDEKPKESVPGRTFRPRFVCLPTNDPFKSTSIMVIHNGLVYWDPWACWLPCPGSLSPSLHLPSSFFSFTKLSGNPTDEDN